jgi:hypothetical protein
LGIFAQYDAPQSQVHDGILNSCLEYGPFLVLWSPEPDISYEDIATTLGMNYQFPFLPVSEALGMDVKTFYQTYKGIDQEVCLETPVDLWLWGTTPTPTP